MISAILINPIKNDLIGRGIDPARLMASAHLRPHALDGIDAMLAIDRVAHLFELAADACSDPLFGLKCGTSAVIERKAPFYYYLNSASTVRDALVGRGRFIKLLTTAHTVRFDEDREPGRWAWQCIMPVGPRVQLTGYLIAFHVRRIRELAGAIGNPQRVDLDQSPLASANDYRSVLGCRVRFDCPDSAIVYGPKALAAPIVTADPDLERILQRILEEAQQRQLVPTILDEAKQRLVQLMNSGTPTLGTLSIALGKPQSAVRRELQEAGTTFRDLLNTVRRDMARELLIDRNLSITEIAFCLGYAEISTFSRQFRSWFGHSPRVARLRARRAPECH